MLPDRVSNPGPLTYESGALPIALRGPAKEKRNDYTNNMQRQKNAQNAENTTELLKTLQRPSFCCLFFL